MYLQNPETNDRRIVKRGKIPKRFLTSAAAPSPRSFHWAQWNSGEGRETYL